VLQGVLIFGVGLAITVAPLTNAVLAAVGIEHAGAASGTNNAVARVASLLANAAVGAVVSASYDRELAAGGRSAFAELGERPLSGGAATPASVVAYRDGMLVGGLLVMAGGVISLAGIVNARRSAPAREVRPVA
jgi:hypothetical protein